jgi:hypothetical protein
VTKRKRPNRIPADDTVKPLRVKPPTFPLPAGERAWQDPFTRRELRRRLYRCARKVGVLAGGYALVFLGIGAVAAYLPAGVADGIIGLLVIAMLVAVPWLIAAGIGVLAVVRMWSFLVRYPWRRYTMRDLRIDDVEAAISAVRLTVKDDDSVARYLVIRANRRREILRGMGTDEVWIAGGLRRGVLVPAGGGELFLSGLDRGRERLHARAAQRAARPGKPPKPRKPQKPPKARTLSPQRQAKAAEKARKRAQAQAAARARLDQKYAARLRRQQSPLPTPRGQRRLGRRPSSLPGQRLLGQNRTGGIFRKK